MCIRDRDERHDGGGQLDAARQAAGGHRAAAIGFRQRARQDPTTHCIDDPGPALGFQRPARLIHLLAADHLIRAHFVQEGFIFWTARQRGDPIAQVRQERHRHAADAAAGASHQHGFIPVSYTHLDVYKRQASPMSSRKGITS